jgi:CHAT domain-containing protein
VWLSQFLMQWQFRHVVSYRRAAIFDLLRTLQDHSPKVKPQIRWCPTGILSFLPLHAAGMYGDNTAIGLKLSDFAISSYTPTVTTLLELAPSLETQTQLQLLAVAQPASHGFKLIPNTEDEVKRIKSVLGDDVLVKTLVCKEATLATVIEGLKASDWAHFACHGIQDPGDPLKSALLVAESEKLTLESLVSIKRNKSGGLAFLSACHTAKGDSALPDEVVHLGAGMLIAGYRGVIATMWSVDDLDAPQVAEDVYQHLKKSGLDTSEAARALDLAVERLRKRPGVSVMSWVPFIHIGS